MYGFILGLKWSLFVLYVQENRKIFLKHNYPRVSTNPFARKCVLIFYIIYVISWFGRVGGGNDIPQPKNVTSG